MSITRSERTAEKARSLNRKPVRRLMIRALVQNSGSLLSVRACRSLLTLGKGSQTMKRNRNCKTILLTLAVVGLAAVSLLGRYGVVEQARAQQQERNNTQKWEYCYILGTYQNSDGHAKAQLLRGSTPRGQIEEVDNSMGIIATLNKLGAEGWKWLA